MDLTDTLPRPAFIDATNAGDSDAFAAAFTPDATLDDWGRRYAGHVGVRDWDHTDNIGVQARFDLLAIEPGEEPDSYVATIRVRATAPTAPARWSSGCATASWRACGSADGVAPAAR